MKLIFDYDQQPTGHIDQTDPKITIPDEMMRDNLPLPNINEIDVVRHYTELSKKNFGIDNNLYPLGSCTMKYNPKVSEELARLRGFSSIHPRNPIKDSQGALEVMWELKEALKEITGMDDISLQQAAGSQCELLGIMIAKRYFEDKGEKRTKVIIPDSSHGTNPASVAMCKLETITVCSDSRGNMDFGEVKKHMNSDVALVMVTNPNTLGLYEENLLEIKDLAHQNGTLMYCDGANMNALLGISRPKEQGFDMIHLNLHKTFATPHGGGGPGAGALGVRSFLSDYLPVPRITKNNGTFDLDYKKEKSVGKVHSFYGNFGILVRALCYIRIWGNQIRQVSEGAVLNANYLLSKIRNHYNVPYDRNCAHEFVVSAKNIENGSAVDIAKRILDYGFHPPTIYFPLIVQEALMIEPTETESKETLDKYAYVLTKIASELKEKPQIVKDAPHTTPSRLDEVKAARQPNLRWSPQ